jgi:ArsR family transcriptional regulator
MAVAAGKYKVQLAQLFHALADQTRLEIIENLKDSERCVCELTDALQTGQSRLSFHLKVLKEAGVIRDRPDGRWIYYSLDRDVIEELVECLEAVRSTGKATRGPRC